MSEVTHDQANLMLRLYELRREPRLREARQWFVSKFVATNMEKLSKKYPAGSEENASFRMVTSYWEMACGSRLSPVPTQKGDLKFQAENRATVRSSPSQYGSGVNEGHPRFVG